MSESEKQINVAQFFNSKGLTPKDFFNDGEWELAERKIVPFGSPKEITVWKNKKIEAKEYKD